ncbi:MAG: transcription initiation protein [Planctomycetes bacterium]|nr:transcription initiation protein [Planctomycetota bacterium]
MNQYLLLLHDQKDFGNGLSADEIQRIIGEYVAWSERLRATGKLVGGQKLRDGEGRIVRERQGKTTVTDGPYSEGKEVIGGYFLVHAESYDEALALCKGNPHTKYGGTIELRCIDAMDESGG